MTRPKFYSQNGEDYFAWACLGRPNSGVFVEVGAFDGVYLSNSYALELLGWRGVCVEPHPKYFDICQANRPAATCVHAACVAESDPEGVAFVAEDLGVYSGIRVADETLAEKYEAAGQTLQADSIQVPALSLNEILHDGDWGRIDFLSVDTEGTELDVLDGLDFEKHTPRIVLLEANTNAERDAAVAYMQDRQYELLRRIGKVNYAFARDPQLVASGRSVKIDCELESLQHPNGVEATAERYRNRRTIRESRPSLWRRAWRRLAGLWK